MRNKFIFGIIFFAMFLLSGCEREIALTEKTAEITKGTILNTNLKQLGRTYISDGVLWCVLSGTGAEFTAKGEKLAITLIGGESATSDNKSAAPGNETNHARVAVYVNGKRIVDTLVDNAIKTIELPLDPAENSVIKIIKLSEADPSIFGISDITVDGGSAQISPVDGGSAQISPVDGISNKISPTPKNNFLIEFIGDSITCGHGVDASDPSLDFSTDTEDFTDTYAYLTAEHFGADYSVVAYSGHGIISGYTDNGVKQPERIVPKFYTKIGKSSDTIGGKKISEIDWNFTEKPDLIVVNLGTNDESYCGDDTERQAEFTEKYIEFLAELRRINPDSVILGSLGAMGVGLCPCVEQAVKTYSESTGDKNVYSMRFDVQKESDGYGANWHPSATTHKKMANKLIEWIDKNVSFNH